jgi:hypothetical protein
MSRWFFIFGFMMMTAVSPSFAQSFLPSDGAAQAERNESGNPTQTASERSSYTATEIQPRQISTNFDMQKYSEEVAEKMRETVRTGLQRTAEEEIYNKRGVALDFLNKPVKLFELTCTTKSGGDGALGETFKFSVTQWSKFCEDAKSLKSGLKCAAKSILNQAFTQVQRKIDEFKDQSFCRVFTDFVNDQISQCITVRFNIPRGQFPGFPALNQCMFGRLGMSVGKDGVKVNGRIVADVTSAHSFKYSSINGKLPVSGFGGTEQQLLGKQGTSALLDKARWTGTRAAAVAGATCGKLDPDIVNALSEFPNRFGDKPWTTSTYLDPSNKNLLNWRPDATKPGGSDIRVIAHWEKIKSDNGQEHIEFRPGADGQVGNEAIAWSVKSGYTYLISCYGFQMYPEDQLCEQLGVGDAWKEQYCEKLDLGGMCCDPDVTDCRAAGLVQQNDICKDGKMKQIVDANGKPMVNEAGEPVFHDPETGNPNCEVVESYGALGSGGRTTASNNTATIRKGLPKVLMCADTCCNPDKNDCDEIGSPVCPKYLGVSQCVPATMDELAKYDPVYSQLRAKPNTMLGGVKMCCATEWCNLCPQDLVATGNGLDKGSTVYMRSSELANVPTYCIGSAGQRNNGGNPLNDVLAYGLVSVDDQVFANTQEACNLMNQGGEDQWSAEKIYHVFIQCPKLNRNQQISQKLFDPGGFGNVFGLLKGFTGWLTGSTNCPESAQPKPVLPEVVIYNMCGNLADVSRYPAPITKIPKIEGEETIGLCSELELCPAYVADEENPYLTVNGGRKCTDTNGAVVPCTSDRAQQVLRAIRGISTTSSNRSNISVNSGASSEAVQNSNQQNVTSGQQNNTSSAQQAEQMQRTVTPPAPADRGILDDVLNRLMGSGSTSESTTTPRDGSSASPRRGQQY